MRRPKLRHFKYWFLPFILISNFALAFPNLERPNSNGPLDLGMSGTSKDLLVSEDDRYIIVNDGTELRIIDTATWALESTQPDDFESTPEDFVFFSDKGIFSILSDGNLKRVIVDDPTENVLTVDLSATSTSFDRIASINRISDNNRIYLLDKSSDTLFIYDNDSQSIVDSFTFDKDINEVAVISLPTDDDAGGSTDKIILTTSESSVFFINAETIQDPRELVLSGTHPNCTSASGSHNLGEIAISPDREVSFVINTTDDVVHLVDNVNETEIDTTSDESGTNPFCFKLDDNEDNDGLTDIVVTKVRDPSNGIRGFVIGSNGVSVFNADLNALEVIEQDPITLSSGASSIAASSSTDGYVYISSTSNDLMVITDNPFVTISRATIEGDEAKTSLNSTDTEFTLTFQSDEVCNGCAYRVIANSDIFESGGTTLLEGSFDTDAGDAVDTDYTTASIDTSGLDLAEGNNRIFVFVDDASGNTGRDSILLSVDFPPPDVEIVSTGFGNESGFITITRLTEEDISHYNLFALLAEDQNNPTCPGGLDFTAATVNNTVAQASSGTTQKLPITGLVNGAYYCVAVQAEDNTGNKSATIVTASEVVLPELLVGIASAAGETGNCQLSVKSSGSQKFAFIFMSLLILISFRVVKQRGHCEERQRRGSLRNPLSSRMMELSSREKSRDLQYRNTMSFRAQSRNLHFRKIISLVLFVFFFFSFSLPQKSQAAELTPQNWAYEFKGGLLFPTDNNLKSFMGTCCTGIYEMRFGRLINSMVQLDAGLGFMYTSGSALGATTGRTSAQNYSFWILPISNSVTFRADWLENQILVPYIGVGVDYMYFKESVGSSSVSGWKFGYHVHGGVQILMEWFEGATEFLEGEGINDIYLTIEGRWNHINNFGSSGLNVAGFSTMVGLLFEF